MGERLLVVVGVAVLTLFASAGDAFAESLTETMVPIEKAYTALDTESFNCKDRANAFFAIGFAAGKISRDMDRLSDDASKKEEWLVYHSALGRTGKLVDVIDALCPTKP